MRYPALPNAKQECMYILTCVGGGSQRIGALNALRVVGRSVRVVAADSVDRSGVAIQENEEDTLIHIDTQISFVCVLQLTQ